MQIRALTLTAILSLPGLGLVGCSDDGDDLADATPDGGPTADTGARPDAQPGSDATTQDSGTEDGGVTPASQFNGYWILDELEVNGNGGPSVLSRTSSPAYQRGDFILAAVAADRLSLDIKIPVIVNGFIMDMVTATVSAEIADKWLLDDGQSVMVLAHDLQGDDLVLTTDRTDPRHTAGSEGPNVMSLHRTPAPTFVTPGSWTMQQIEYGNGAMIFEAGVCTDMGNGEFGIVETELEIGPRLLFGASFNRLVYTSTTCTGTTSDEVHEVSQGVIEELGAGTARQYFLENEGPGTLEWSVVTSTAGLDLLLQGCTPSPCDPYVPTRILLAPN